MATETWPSDVTIESNLLDQQQKAWTLFKLGDLGKAITGITPPMADNDQLDVIPFITPAEITGSFNGIKPQRWFHSKYRHVARIVPANTILMVCIGSVGKCSLTDQEVGYNQQINALILDQSKAFPPFVLAIFLSPIFKKQLNSKISCTAIPILNLTAWCSLNIPLPPLEEQQRIGALFKELDRNISLNRALLDKLTKLKTSLLEQMFPRVGESVPQLRFAKVDSSYNNTTLGQITYFGSEVGSTSQRYVSTENMLPNFNGVAFTSNNDSHIGLLYERGDILISNIRPYLKKIWLADTDGCCSTDVLVLKIKNKHSVLSRFLFHVLASDWFVDYVMQNVKGSKMPRGDKSHIMQTPILLPSIAEQQRISAFFKAMDERIAQQRAKLNKLEQLKQALLEQMFVSAPV